MSYENIRFEVQDAVATITIAREKALNALNAETLDELQRAVDEVASAPGLRGALLIGQGEKAFVAGADLRHLQTVRHEGRARARRGQALLQRIEDCPRPIVACVNGFALGGGLELALACHFRYASKNALLGLPEVKLGVIPGYGGTQRLPRLIGRGPAVELILRGEPVPAEEALRLGLVNRVFETREALLEGARTALKDIAARGPLAIQLALEAVRRGLEVHQAGGMEIEADLFGVALGSDDAGEGIAAFLEKRAAAFQGK